MLGRKQSQCADKKLREKKAEASTKRKGMDWHFPVIQQEQAKLKRRIPIFVLYQKTLSYSDCMIQNHNWKTRSHP